MNILHTVLRRVGLAALSIVVFAAAPTLHAAYPDKPIRIVIPAPAGGTSDVVTRIISEPLAAELGQPVVLDYRSGANGAIANVHVARGPADGYTLLLATPGFAANNAFNKDSQYDPITDFTPVGTLGETPAVLLVAGDSPYRALPDLLAAGRAKDSPLSYGSGGVGSSNHLNAELFKARAGVQATHVPYRGDSQVLADLIGGQISFTLLNAPGAVALLTAGKVRALGTATAARSPSLPQVPTLVENGVDAVGGSWFFYVVPKATPQPVVDRLDQALQKVLSRPEIRARLVGAALDPYPTDAKKAAQLLRQSVERAHRTAAGL